MGVGLLSGKYSGVSENSLESDSVGISPFMFKSLIGKNHVDFSSKQQQDAQEFYLHLIDVLDKNKNNRPDKVNPVDALTFAVEDRFECTTSGKVKYIRRNEYCLPLPIPLHLASNLSEVKAYESRLKDAETKGEKL